jgi:membrane associated rhomboid family serine protease
MFPLRDDQPRYSRPLVCVLLIVVNAAVFLHEMQLEEFSRNFFIGKYGVVPDHLRLYTLVTSQFLHGGWLHIIGNMVFLWAFGRSVEDSMGSWKFLWFYLTCGAVACLAQVFATEGSHAPLIGASGAIAGVMGAYVVRFPHAQIRTLVFLFIFITRFDIPALFFIPYWFVMQVINGAGAIGYSSISEGGTAWFAHIGGFLAGLAGSMWVGTPRRRRWGRNYRW